MAKPDSKKKVPGARNPDRKNGKAWKKDKFKPKRQRTPERQEKDFLIRMERERRRQENKARREAEKLAAEAAAEALKLIEEAEQQAKLRHDPLGVAKRIKPKTPVKPMRKKRKKPTRSAA